MYVESTETGSTSRCDWHAVLCLVHMECGALNSVLRLRVKFHHSGEIVRTMPWDDGMKPANDGMPVIEPCRLRLVSHCTPLSVKSGVGVGVGGSPELLQSPFKNRMGNFVSWIQSWSV